MLYEVITNTLEAFPAKLKTCEEMLENSKVQLANAKIEVAKPFPKEEELKTRITSYNVCYTKLLRGTQERDLRGVIDIGETKQSSDGDRQTGEGAGGTYNVADGEIAGSDGTTKSDRPDEVGSDNRNNFV